MRRYGIDTIMSFDLGFEPCQASDGSAEALVAPRSRALCRAPGDELGRLAMIVLPTTQSQPSVWRRTRSTPGRPARTRTASRTTPAVITEAT